MEIAPALSSMTGPVYRELAVEALLELRDELAQVPAGSQQPALGRRVLFAAQIVSDPQDVRPDLIPELANLTGLMAARSDMGALHLRRLVESKLAQARKN